MADEQLLQELTLSRSTVTAESSGPVFPQDPDTRPIGRCYPEVQRVKGLIDHLRTTHAALGDAVAALGNCRANAQLAQAKATAAALDREAMIGLLKSLGNVLDNFSIELTELSDCETCQQPDTLKAE
jgi:hypothetical protein